MYSFINKPIGVKKNALNDLRIKRLNYLIAKNNTKMQEQPKKVSEYSKYDSLDNIKINIPDSNVQKEKTYNFENVEKVNNKINTPEKIELNISELHDVPVPNVEANNNQLFVLKNNIIALINLSCISNVMCKNILEELNNNSNNKQLTVVGDIWSCVNGISDALDKPLEKEKEKEKKFSIDKEKVNKIREEESEVNKSQLINYKSEMISKVDSMFTKAVNNLSSEVINDIMEYTNIILQHSRKSLHDRLDDYLNSFLDNIFK
jgi:hypothetical protein